MKYSVYEIWSEACGGVYIGRTKMPSIRWKAHCAMAKYHNAPLYEAMRKHGVAQFRFVVVEDFDNRLASADAEVRRISMHINNGQVVFNRNTGSTLPNPTKPIGVRPKQGTALQRIVDQAREANASLSPIIHDMAVAHERALRRKAKQEQSNV